MRSEVLKTSYTQTKIKIIFKKISWHPEIPVPPYQGYGWGSEWRVEVCKHTLQCLSILCTSGESVFHSANNLTWTEAQAFCRSNQSTLIPGTKAGFPYPHWTGLYHRLSDWIHVLGNQTETKIKSLTPFGTKFFGKLRAALETFIWSFK